MEQHSSASRARRLGVALSLAGTLASLALFAAPAGAVQTHLFSGYFGPDEVPAFGNSTGMAFDPSGDLLVIDTRGGTKRDGGLEGYGSVSRYHADGTPSGFTALGSNVIDGETGPGGKPCAEEPASCDQTPENGFEVPGQGYTAFGLSDDRIQVAVDNSGTATDGNIYVTQAETRLIDIFASDGDYLGQLTQFGTKKIGSPCGVAVDSSGAVYVADQSRNAIHKYVPSAATPVNADYVEAESITGLTEPCHLALGVGPSAGSIFAIEFGAVSKTYKIDLATRTLEYVVHNEAGPIAIDAATGHLFAGYGKPISGGGFADFIDEYDVSGSGSAVLLSRTDVGVAHGIAIDGAGGEIYVSRNRTIGTYDTSIVTLAEVTVEEATGLTPSRATVKGTVDPDGVELSECRFEYGVASGSSIEGNTVEDNTVPCGESPAEIGSGEDPVPVHADLSGLTPEKSYAWRLAATNSDGTATSKNEGFLTPRQATTAAAIEADASSATLNGSVHPDGAGVSECRFEYLTDADFDADFANEMQTVTLAGATGGVFQLSFEGDETGATGEGDLHGSAKVTGVTASSGAFVKGQTISGAGIPAGTTIESVEKIGDGIAVLILSQPASVTASDVALSADLPHDASPGLVEASLWALPSMSNSVQVSGAAGGPYTVEFRQALKGTDVSELGADASGLQPSGASITVATIANGADGWETGVSEPCAESEGEIGTGESPVPVHADLEGLDGGTEYRFRLLATGTGGTTLGGEKTFATLSTATSGVANPVTGTTARLNGSVNPEGGAVSACLFEYGPTSAYGQSAPCAQSAGEIGTGESSVPVHADIAGLRPNGTTYHFRLVATNQNGTASGVDKAFETEEAVVTIPASGVGASSATLNGTVDPDGAGVSECSFEWGIAKDPQEVVQELPETAPCVPGPAGIGTGSGPVAVTAELSDLNPGTVYHYRLKGVYAGGLAAGQVLTFQTAGPAILATWSEDVGYGKAALKAAIDPEDETTTFHFEYGTSEAYGSQTAEILVGSDSSTHNVSRIVEGLDPGTTYHFRAVASSLDGTSVGPDRSFTTYEQAAPASCPNQAFRTGPSTALPDCRAYEMVSPVEKNGGNIFTSSPFVEFPRPAFNQSAIGGGKITYSAGTAFGDQLSARGSNQYMATRGATGWTTDGINAPLGHTLGEPEVNGLGDVLEQFKLFTPDLSSAWVTDINKVPLTPDASNGWANLYRRDNATDSYEAVTNVTPSIADSEPENYFPNVQGASADFDHVVFTVTGALTPNAAMTTNAQLYDYSAGALHLVSVLPDGTAYAGHANAGTDGVGGGGRSFGHEGMVQHAVSEDGGRVFWTALVPPGREGSLYVRENPAEPQSALQGGDECTEPDKACTRTIAGGPGNAFWAASADGGTVIYSSGGKANESQATMTLHRYDVEAESAATIAGEVGGVVGASDDASYVYFTSKEALDAGARAGEWNLYLDHEGTKKFIGTLSQQDRNTPEGGDDPRDGIDAGEAKEHIARVTPDGQHLAFQSNRSLTGYDNTDALNGKADIEVYLYDAGADQLVCASCNPSGARPAGQELLRAYRPTENGDDLSFPTNLWAGAWLQAWVHNAYASRALSDDGARLYFNAFDALVPEDTNGAQDVYQWEAAGTGSCSEASAEYSELNGGCVELISTGTHPKRSEFIDATPDGSEVFIETSSRIDPRDPGLIDIYTARVGGGLPIPTEPPECAGDACQSIPPAPDDATPASAAFRGAGNVRPEGSCAATSSRAGQLARRAKRMARAAKHASPSARAKQLRRRAARLASESDRLSKRAARCRRAERRAGR